jgi:RimJ/RimL family protein N-acetyltransferase
MNILLTTPRLIIRPLRVSDSAAMFAYRSRPEVWHYQIWRPADESEIQGFIERQSAAAFGTPGTWFNLAITLRDTGEMIGDVGLHFPEGEPAQLEVGITISPRFQKRGFAAEGLGEIFRFVFFSLGKERIHASVDPRNLPSIRLLSRMGMRQEEILRGSLTIRGELVDDAIFAICRDAFQAKSGV